MDRRLNAWWIARVWAEVCRAFPEPPGPARAAHRAAGSPLTASGAIHLEPASDVGVLRWPTSATCIGSSHLAKLGPGARPLVAPRRDRRE
jgi:hypothetical protein